MTAPFPVLATASEIRAIARRALEALDTAHAVEYDYGDVAQGIWQGEIIAAAIEAMRFCSRAAGLLRDPSLMPELTAAIRAFEYDDYARPHTATLGAGVTTLLAAGAPVDADVRELAAHGEADVREAVAAGLRADRDDALALLETLATDPVPAVRKAARATLATVREVPWWTGKFASDPLARVEPERAAEIAPVLARLSEIVDVPSYQRAAHNAEFVELAARLPDALAVELIERAITGLDRWGMRDSPLLGAMLGRRGGVEALVRLVVHWCEIEEDYSAEAQVGAALATLTVDTREAVARALLDAALRRPDAERGELHHSPAVRCAAIAATAWPPERDPTPVLDAALALPVPEDKEYDYAASALSAVLEHTTFVGSGRVLERVLAARLGNYPGAWTMLAHRADDYLARVDGPLLRTAVETALRSGEGEIVSWALERLVLGPAWDATRDPPRAQLALRLFEDPRFRREFVEHSELRMTVAPALRQALRDGAADLGTADAALDCVETLWGLSRDGAERSSAYARPRRGSEEDARAARQAARFEAQERWKDFLGPPALHGPATDEEWARYRAVRDGTEITEYADWLGAMQMFPPGPIDPVDRAFIQRGIEYVQSGYSKIAMCVAIALGDHATVDELPLFELLEKLDPSDDGTPSFTYELRAAEARLGIVRPKSATADADADADKTDDDAWGDDDDDGDDA